MDLLSALDKNWHRGCFKCSHCQMALSLNAFAALEGKPYCKPHYSQLFKAGGGSYESLAGRSANRATMFNPSTAFTGFTAPTLKKVDNVADRSAPVIEKDVEVKHVDRTKFTDEVSKEADLKPVPPELMADRSNPVVEVVDVKTVDRKAVLVTVQKAAISVEIKKIEIELKVTEVVDKSAPVIENVEIKKVDRSKFTQEVVSGVELKKPDSVHD